MLISFTVIYTYFLTLFSPLPHDTTSFSTPSLRPTILPLLSNLIFLCTGSLFSANAYFTFGVFKF